ncbi:GNAT family N-acetyltransferase [Microlunatus flavus]|uniref:Acetyltransferase (GNAT) family protein n=1 Tax=Microlunatus flavus TaxID=1036181 RepID=A0A1H9I8C5_9ACTN|nr:GNAT family N-acetyltransferase [Microlunatus flavus]SEQ70768.1 Acetyltransferase (GNAT) family protein [Microlunatus flavus]
MARDVGASICYRVRGPVDDVALSALHDAAFGEPGPVLPWNRRLHHHSLTWVEAYAVGDGPRAALVGFVNVAWDGGVHAFLLDTCVAPERQGQGVGAELVRRAAAGAAEAGCAWLHVDFEPHLAAFYARCGFGPTQAGLLSLRARG